MHLVDTHQHLWDLARLPCSWTKKIPPLHRTFTLADYEAAAAGTGITKAVFMECDVDDPHQLAEARYAQSLADQNPLIAGIVASARPEKPDFREQLERLAQLPKLRGIRRALHVVPDGVSQDQQFRQNVDLLAEFNLTFDLCVLPHQLPFAVALIKACPRVTFILDHCGVPDIKGRSFDPWRDDLGELARQRNVICKISGLIAYAGPEWKTDDLRPWFDHVVATFGWDRVVWGGDWPVCTLGGSLARWVETTAELTASASDEQRAKLYHLNAEHIYRLA